MSKEKDFEKAAMDYCEDHSHCIYFEAGAEHGYQHAIDKACEWLTNYFVNYLQFDKQIINDFRKAMED